MGFKSGLCWATQGQSETCPEATQHCLGRMLQVIVVLKGEPDSAGCLQGFLVAFVPPSVLTVFSEAAECHLANMIM